MAAHTVSASQKGAFEKTLVAATADSVTFTNNAGFDCQLLNEGSTGISYTTDGTAPVVGAAANGGYLAPSSADVVRVGPNAVVKLICASGAPKYSVWKRG